MGKIAALVVVVLIVGAGIWYFLGRQIGIVSRLDESQSKQINIAGSSSALSLLTPVISAFEKKNPDIKIRILPGTETSDGVKGVGEGMLEVGALARPLKDEEKAKYPNLRGLSFAKDAMILAVNPNVTVKSLTKEQVTKIHSGVITDWSEVGGEKGRIVVMDREESESSKVILRKYIIGADLKMVKSAIMMHSGDAMNKGIVETPNAIGQTSLGVVRIQSIMVNPLAIDGVTPNASTIKAGTYQMVREYGITVPKGTLKSEVAKFVDFLFGSEAQKILSGYEIVPLSQP